jgi:hypothetical protein
MPWICEALRGVGKRGLAGGRDMLTLTGCFGGLPKTKLLPYSRQALAIRAHCPIQSQQNLKIIFPVEMRQQSDYFFKAWLGHATASALDIGKAHHGPNLGPFLYKSRSWRS